MQALARGKTLGGPRKLRAEDYPEVVRMQEAGLFLPEIGKRLGVSKKTVVRLIREHERIQETDRADELCEVDPVSWTESRWS